MATPLTNIENGILLGDWTLVCQGFNKLTGKSLSPPAPAAKPVVKFNPETAPKKELYKFMTGVIEMGPIKDYTVADLREMAVVHAMGETDDDYIEPIIDNTYTATTEAPVRRDNGFVNPFKKGGNDILPDGGQFLDGFRYRSGKSKSEMLPIDKIKVKAVVDPQLVKVGDPSADYTPREPVEKVDNKCMKCSKTFKAYKGIGVEVDGELKSLCPICSEQV